MLGFLSTNLWNWLAEFPVEEGGGGPPPTGAYYVWLGF